MKNTFILSLLFLISCGEKAPAKMRRTQLSQTGEVQLIVTGVSDIQKMKQDAVELGLKAEGESIVFLSGDAQKINQLEIPSNENFNYILDVEISIDRNEPFTPDIDALYLAKKDFGILEFWKTHPLADGRGVIAGVMEDRKSVV